MKLTVLGKYGPFSTNGGSTSGYLLTSNANKSIVLDAGSGTISKALKRQDISNFECVILSHLHFDHIADMGILSYATTFLKNDKKLKVYLPNDGSCQLKSLLDIACFDCVFIDEDKEYVEGQFKFKFYKMNHPVLAYGVKIMCDYKSFAYSGDTTIDGDLDGLLGGVDFAVLDGAFTKEEHTNSKPHMSIFEVGELSKKFKTKTLVSHINYAYSDKKVRLELKNYPLCMVAKENKEYKI